MFQSMYVERKSLFQRLLVMLASLISVTVVVYLHASNENEPVQSWSPISDNINVSTIDDNKAISLELNRRLKRLPQAIIIGTRKSGTRALLKFLELNPSIRAAHSEIHFFDKPHIYKRGLQWYRDQMPESDADEVTIEKSPAYFVTPGVPEKVKAMNASIKLVVIFRDPVTRLISDYSQLVANKIETLEDEEEDEYGSGEQVSVRNISSHLIEAVWDEAEGNFKNYVQRTDGGIEEQRRAVKIGMYSNYLEKWRTLFSIDQFHFVSGETLISNPASELRKLEVFLGLKPTIKSSDFVFNPRKGFFCLAPKHLVQQGNKETLQVPLMKTETEGNLTVNSLASCLCKTKGRRHVKVSQSLVEKLRRFYAPYNEYLYSLIGSNFDWPDK